MNIPLEEIETKKLLVWLETTKGRYGFWSHQHPSYADPHKLEPEVFPRNCEKVPFYSIQSELKRRQVYWD